jgi:catechol 2,3-dioxygenase-like lactoylglutathione lyase family enzyme
MKHYIKSIRTFIGAKDFDISRNFYNDLGFKEVILSDKLSYFKIEQFGFYLQKAYIKDWVDNLMVFLEVDDVERYLKELKELKLDEKYANVRLTPISDNDWGRECFLHDPSGVLWHFGEFYSS